MKKVSTSTGIIIIVISALVIFGGVFICQYLSTKNSGSWKTYKNIEQGFELSYPAEFAPDENNNYPVNGDIIVSFRRPSYGDWSFDVGSTNYNSFNAFIKTESNVKQKQIIVAGKTSQEFSYYDGNIKKITVFVPKNSREYFSIDWKSVEDVSANKTIQNNPDQFDEIISSFKFIK